MNSLAVILPAHEPRLDGSRRDALLTAHATQLARYGSKNARVRVFTTQELQGHEVLARLAAFRPTRIIIEHTPLAYEAHSAMPLAITSWGRAHSVPVVLVAHVEFGRACDPPEAAIAAALLANGPLLTQASRILCHETNWARVIGERFRSCVDRLEVLGAWPLIEPGSLTPVDASAPRLLLVDEVPQKMLAEIVERLKDDGAVYTCAALFKSVIPLEMKTEIVETPVQLAAAIAASSLVVIPESRYPDETRRWVRTAVAFGRRVMVVKSTGAVEHIERPAETWAAIAHTILSAEEERALAASLEEDVEEPSVGI